MKIVLVVIWLAINLSTAANELLPATTNDRYSLTIYVIYGANLPGASTNRLGGGDSSLGHVFIELDDGPKQMVIGYYGKGKPADPTRPQLKNDGNLVANDNWDVKKTYQITEEGYSKAHAVIDKWGKDDACPWRPNHNCGDFAAAIAEAAGVDLIGLPKTLGIISRPNLWGKYLEDHGGTVNVHASSNKSSDSSVPSPDLSARIIYFAQKPSPSRGGPSIDFEYPRVKFGRQLSAGVIGSGGRTLCAHGGEGPKSIYSSSGKYLRLDTNTYMVTCSVGYAGLLVAETPLLPGSYRLIVCDTFKPDSAGDIVHPGDRHGMFNDMQTQTGVGGSSPCLLDTFFINRKTKEMDDVITGTDALYDIPIVLSLPQKFRVIVQLQ